MTALPIDAGTWKLDPTHSQLGFSIRHLGISNVRGLFPTVDGTVEVASDGTSKIDVEVELASVQSGNQYRDEHLQAEPFFDTANHPKLTFSATKVEVTGDNVGKIHGDLTIRGITKPVTLDATFNGTGESPMDQSFRAGFHAVGSINRTDFGVSYGVPMVSDEVQLSIDVQLVKQP